jgi:hypothetical protein
MNTNKLFLLIRKINFIILSNSRTTKEISLINYLIFTDLTIFFKEFKAVNPI